MHSCILVAIWIYLCEKRACNEYEWFDSVCRFYRYEFFQLAARRFPRNLYPINPDLQNICSGLSRQYNMANFWANRYKRPPSWYWSCTGSSVFLACSASLRDVRTMLAVLNRNLALTTSALMITGNRALLMSRLGKSYM